MQNESAIADALPADKVRPSTVMLLISLLLCIAFYPILFGGQTLCYRDFGVMGIPTAWHHRFALWSGELPLWNPYSNCGVPFLAQWGTMVLYPPSLIYVVLPLPWSLNLFCIVHFLLGGMGMYYLARKWVRSDCSAAFAAVAFVFNGITQATLSWPNYTAALALMPWVVLSVERAWEGDSDGGGTIRRMARAAVVAALQILTGVPELCLLTWAVITLLGFRKFLGKGESWFLIRQSLAIVTIAAAVCAAQLLPFFQLLQNSQRSVGFTAEKWALPIWGWANLVLPRFHTFNTPEGTIGQYGQTFLTSTYLGAPLLLLSIFALRKRTPLIWILGGISLLCSVLALGSAGLLYPTLKKLIPALSIARYPVKFLLVLPFTVPLLAAFGLREMTELGKRATKPVITIVLVITGIFGLLLWVNILHPLPYDRLAEIKANSLARWFLLILFSASLFFRFSSQFERYSSLIKMAPLLVIVIDCLTHLPKQNPTAPASVFTPNLWAASQDRTPPKLGEGRFFITPQAEDKLLFSNVGDLTQDLQGKRLALWSHLNLLDNAAKVNGSATLQLGGEAIVQNALYSKTNANLEAWLDFLNVTLETSPKSVIEWQQRSNAMPFITAGQKPVRQTNQLFTPSFAFNTEVALAPWSTELESLSSTAVELSDISVTSHQITFHARASQPSVAVIPISWHPAWKASISQSGGKPSETRIFRANIAFMGIPLPAGGSDVSVQYVDNFFRLGVAISGLTLLMIGVLCLLESQRARIRALSESR